MTTTSDRLRYSSRLDAEWDHLRRSRRHLDRARRWAEADPVHPLAAVVTGLRDLDTIVAATQRGARHDDEVLLRLVELARSDELAGRIVIQRLLPGLIVRALPYREFGCPNDPVAVVVPSAWLAVRRYDTERRRRHVAASLISDAVFDAFRAPRRRRSSTEVVRAPDRFDVGVAALDEPSSLEQLAEVLRSARAAGALDEDLDVLRRLVQLGSTTAVAIEEHVTARTIRNRRDRAVTRIRATLAA
jgi:hypothetical protein